MGNLAWGCPKMAKHPMTGYRPLSESSVIDYIRHSPLIGTIFDPKDSLVSHDLADGNVNLVFRVAGRTGRPSVIVKQALPYARAVGEGFPMPLDRAEHEYRVLTLEAQQCPTLVPHVYHFDRSMALMIMEDLQDLQILRHGLMQQQRYPHLAQDLGQFLARTLFMSSDFALDSASKKQWVQEYSNPALCQVTEDLVFTHPFMNHAGNRWDAALQADVHRLWSDEALLSEVLRWKYVFMTHAEALIHGDLHTGSIMVSANQTKVIDPEFSFVGPMAFDIGSLLAHLAISYLVHESIPSPLDTQPSYGAWLFEVTRTIWSTFVTEFLALWAQSVSESVPPARYREANLRRILRESTGFGGVEIIRRVLGLAHVADLDTITDVSQKTRAARTALTLGRAWIMQSASMNTIEDVVDLTTEVVAAAKKEGNPHGSVS